MKALKVNTRYHNSDQMIPERTCLECGDVLHGRSDQKFCSDQCRNAYHNRQLGEANPVIRKINRILRKNHALLAALNSRGKVTFSRNELEKMDFNFHYFTHSLNSRTGRTVYFCYELGYMPVNGDRVKLVRPSLPYGSHTLHDIRQ